MTEFLNGAEREAWIRFAEADISAYRSTNSQEWQARKVGEFADLMLRELREREAGLRPAENEVVTLLE